MHYNVPKCKQMFFLIFDYYYYYSEFKEIHRHHVMVWFFCVFFLHYPPILFKNNVCFVQVLELIKMPYY